MSVTEKIKHLHGNKFLVPLDLINFAEGDGDENSLAFRNPRCMGVGTIKPKGLDKHAMDQLQESIKTEGVNNPLQLRWVYENGEKKMLQLVDGERRTRCIKKLVKEKVECFDPVTGNLVKATELYNEVEVAISEMDDQTAFKHAFSSNERAVGIGEGTTVSFCRALRKAGYTDKQIINVTGMSTTWLKDTDVLIGLDDKTFTALSSDQINRSAALELAQVEDLAERMILLENARNFAISRLSKVKKKLEAEVESAEKKADLAKAEAAVATHRGDEETKAEAEEKAELLKDKVKTKRKEKEEIESGAAKITSKDLQKAKSQKQKEAGGEAERSALTKAKIAKYWHQPCAALIKAEGLDEEGNEVEVDLEDARLAKLLCEQIEKGEIDILKILKHHNKGKIKRAGG